MVQLVYSSQQRQGLPGQLYRAHAEILPGVNNTRLHQQDTGTMVPLLAGDEYGVTIEGVAVTIVSSGTDTDDAILLAAAIKAKASLAGIVGDAQANGADVVVTYKDFETHAVMTTILGGGGSSVTPIVISQAADPGQNFAFGSGVIFGSNSSDGHLLETPIAGFNPILFAGVVLREKGIPGMKFLPGNEAVPSGYPVNMVRKGYVWVRTNTDVAIGDDVFLGHENNNGAVPGVFRNDNAAGSATKVAGRWATAGTVAGGKSVLELNLI